MSLGPGSTEGVILGLDIGGTKLAAAAADRSGSLLASRVAPTPQEVPPDTVIARLLALADDARRDSGASRGVVARVGVSYGGPIDWESGVALTCHHLPGWDDYPVRDRIAAGIGAAVVADNDANAAALGEHCFGAGRDARCLLYLTISSGIGGGVIIDGQIHRGAHGLAGEIGHIAVAPVGLVCACGKRGCLESIASGWSIARAAERALDCSGASALASLPRPLTAKQVCDAAREGDPVGAAVLAEAAEGLGRAIAAAANLLDPDLIVIGGGVARAGDVLMEPVRSTFERCVFEAIARRVAIVTGELDDRAAVMGAVALAAGQPE